MAIYVPATTFADYMLADTRRHPAIYGEAPSSGQMGPDNTDLIYLNALLDAGRNSASTRIEQLYTALRDQLISVSKLPRAWDSYTADPPNDVSVTAAREALAQLRSLFAEPAAIVPSAEGGVAICFNKGERWGQIEFLNEGEAYALIYGGLSSPGSWQITEPVARSLPQTWNRISAHLQS